MRTGIVWLWLALAACAPPPTAPTRMTPQIVADHGAHVFAADRHRVFEATTGALKALGYDIAFSDETAGVIKTSPRSVGQTSHTETLMGGSTTTTASYQRSYVVQLTVERGQTRVEATPRMFADGAEISQQPVWTIGVENNAWYQLFAEIGSNLGAASSVSTAPATESP